MWLDIGYEGAYDDYNEINSPSNIGKKIKILLDAYELENNKRNMLIPKIYEQMQRVGSSSKLGNRIETYKWANNCEIWLRKHQSEILSYFIY